LARIQIAVRNGCKRYPRAAGFFLFAQDFLGGQSGFTFTEATASDRPGFRLTLRQAAEFLSKKRLHRQLGLRNERGFCFWSFPQWKRVLTESGFRLLENPNQPGESSRVYTNPWIVEHRHAGHAEVLDLQVNPCPGPRPTWCWWRKSQSTTSAENGLRRAEISFTAAPARVIRQEYVVESRHCYS